MSKTASIASSAGASFENTSAFLAQMIESTREAPDAIGTSVKTIVARFNELKKAPEDIGEIDGEIVDANAIETALRSVGISLRDTEGQFRNFDEIIYELAEKWDGLSRNQQRYIATVAAGSRQQSRFIALLSDYDRLMELTNAANNAAGASNRQYEKTLDSLESKLAKLDNAWTTFTTTIVNSNLYKDAIDLLGGIVNAINDITSALDGNSGKAKIALLFGALKTGDVAIKGFTESWRQGGSVLESVGAGFKKVGDSAKNAVNKVKEMKQSLKDAVSEAKASATAYQTLMKKAPGLKKQKQEGTKKYKRAQEMFKEAETDDGYVFAQNLESEGIDQEISAQAELNKLQNDWVKTLNLTDDQRKISLALQQKATDLNNTELGTNQALILAKYDLIAADKIQDLTQDELNKKTQIANMLLEAQAVGGVKGLIAKYALIAADKLQEKTSEKNIIVKLLDNVATQALTGSTWALVGSIFALITPVLLVVAAFVALIAIWKIAEHNSLEKQLERSKEAAELAATAAEEAAEAYDELNESMASLEDHYNNLEQLAKGTSDWKEEVKATNEEFQELIDKYPSLIKYFAYDAESGTWKPKSEEDEAQIEKEIENLGKREDRLKAVEAREDYFRGTAHFFGIQDEIYDSRGLYFNRAEENEREGVSEAAEYASSNEFLDDIMQGRIRYDLELEKWLGTDKDTDIHAGYLNSDFGLSYLAKMLYEGIDEYSASRDIYYSQVFNAQRGMLPDSYTQSTSELVSTWLIQNTGNIVDAQKETYAGIANMPESEVKAKLADIYGVEESEVIGKGSGKWEINGKTLEKDTVQRALEMDAAVQSAPEQATAFLETLNDTYEAEGIKDNKKLQQAIKKAFTSEDGKALTEEEITLLSENSAKVEEAWSNAAKENELIGMNFEKYLKSNAISTDLFDVAKNTLEEALGISRDKASEITKSMTYGQANQYANQIKEFSNRLGAAAAQNLNGVIQNFSKDLEADPEALSQFRSYMQGMDDWIYADSWDQLAKNLEATGANIPSAALEDFIEKAKDASQAISKIDFSTFTESALELQAILAKIKSGEQGRNFSEEDYKKIIEKDNRLKNDFVKTIDGVYYYTGVSLDKISELIESKTSDLYDSIYKNTRNKIKAGEVLDKEENEQLVRDLEVAYANESTGLYQDTLSGSAIRAKDLLVKNGVDINLLGIENLGNETMQEDIEKLSTNEQKEIVNALLNLLRNLPDIKNEGRGQVFSSMSTQDSSMNTMRGSQFSYLNLLNDNPAWQMYLGTIDSLQSKATNAGVSEELIERQSELRQNLENARDNYNLSRSFANREAFQQAKKDLDAFNASLTNTTNIANQRSGLQGFIEDIQAITEDLEGDNSLESRIQQTGAALEDFDIIVDKTNVDKYQQLLTDLITGGDVGKNAILELISDKLLAGGIDEADFPKLFEVYGLGEMEEGLEDIGQDLVDIGLLEWKMIDETHRRLRPNWDLYQSIVDTVVDSNSWESAYDWIYNYTQQSEALVREREKAERTYLRLLESEQYTAEEVLKTSNAQVDVLKRQSIVESEAAKKAQTEIKDLFSNSKYSNYVAYNQNTGAVIADYPRLDKITDEEFGEDFDEFISELEELRDTYQDAVDNLEDIEDDLKAIAKERKDAYSTLIDQVQEALIQSYQDIIDERSSVSEAIKDAQDTIVNSMQEQIDATRQARENDKTTSDLEDRRLRLAALMRDTSGGNSVEIAKLQKELTEAEENYTDTLVDQALERLQDANEKAAEQRDKQIELAQAQLDAYSESSVSFDDAEAMLAQALNDASLGTNFATAFEASSVGDLLKNQAEAMNKVAWSEWTNELSTDAANAWAYLSGDESLQEDIKTVQAKISDATSKLEGIKAFLGSDSIAARVQKGEEVAFKLEGGVGDKIDNVSSSISDLAAALREAMEKGYIAPYEAPTNQRSYDDREEHPGVDRYHYKFATGGLADFTGPAWLDGTPTRPEMVLNPQDTANFIVLKDILSDILVGASSTASATKSGDNYYDIAINVDSISDDYDVEQMADKVRDMIYQDSIYRNVNTVNRVK